MQTASPPYSKGRRIVDFISVIVGAGIAIYVASLALQNRPFYVRAIDAAIFIVAGYLLIRIISSIITRVGEHALGPTKATGIRNFFQILFAVVVIAVIAGLFGVNLYLILGAAGFGAIVLGLAAQQVLGNIFAGISLIISRPFDVGDRVTMTMSQYSLIAPSYSHEALVPGYTGVVLDIGIFYTSMLLDNGSPTVLPNSAVIGAMVFNHTKADDRVVQTRVALDKRIDYETFKTEVSALLRSHPDAGKKMDLDRLIFEITDVVTDTYQVSILASTREKFDETVRTIVIPAAIAAERKLKPPDDDNEKAAQ